MITAPPGHRTHHPDQASSTSSEPSGPLRDRSLDVSTDERVVKRRRIAASAQVPGVFKPLSTRRMEPLPGAPMADTGARSRENVPIAREGGGETMERKVERGVYFPEQKAGKARSGKNHLLGGPRAPGEVLHPSLNGKVAPDSVTWGGKKVLCRHFALAYVQADVNKLGKLFEDFSSVGGIKKAFEGEYQDAEKEYYNFAVGVDKTDIQVMSGRQLGAYMKCLAEKLHENAGSNAGDKKSELRSLLCSTNHAMGLQVQRKYSRECGESFVARVYDPNITGNAPRLVVLDPKELEKFSLHDMLMVAKNVRVAPHAPRNVYSDKECSIVAIGSKPSISGAMKRLDPPVSGESIYLAMHHGSSLDLKAMSESAGPSAGGRFIDMMGSRNVRIDENGRPSEYSGLGAAIMNGHSSVIELYVDQVLHSDKNSVDMKVLLQSRVGTNGVGLTALDRSIAASKAVGAKPEGVGMFIDALQKFLPAKGVDMHSVLGNASLLVGLSTGSGEAVDQFVEKIRQVPGHVLSDESKIKMFNETGLFRAFRKSHHKSLNNIIQTIDLSSALRNGEKADLYSRSGFQGALRRGDPEWASTVYSGVSRISGLSRESRINILLIGLPELLRERNLDVMDAIMGTFSLSSIPPDQVNELLTMQTGLAAALLKGDCTAVLRSVESIDACRSLDDGQKESMKSAWGLETVLEEHGEDAVWKVYDTTRSKGLEGLDDQLKERWRRSVMESI